MTSLFIRRFSLIAGTLLLSTALESLAGTPVTFRDCEQCPEMVLIPSGKFSMGTPKPANLSELSEEQRLFAGELEEFPQHAVSVKAFALGVREVTQKEWRFVMGDNPSAHPGDDLPVENISWEEAKAFAFKLSQLTGKTYRLPTEAEWEYAARAGSTTPFYFGATPESLGEHAWFSGNAEGKTHPVGRKKPNAFGLHDMYGNVWERLEDCWHIDYDDAPNDGSVWDREDCDRRVVRGGSYVNLPQFQRSAYRFRYAPTSRYEFVGLRIARAP